MKKVLFFIFVILQSQNVFSQFEPPVVIDPPNPMVGDVIRVGLFTTFFPPCLILPLQNQQGQTHLFEFDNNHIDFTVISSDTPLCNPFPVSPAPREYYELGELQVGDYTIQTFWVSRFISLPVPPNITPAMFGQEIAFSVTQPKPIDSLSKPSLFLLMFSVLTLTLLLSKRKGVANFWR